MEVILHNLLTTWWGIILICCVFSLIWLLISAKFYRAFFKRFYDIVLSLIALIALSPLLLLLTIFGSIMMRGNPFFVQQRPGKDEKIFKMIKFRTMTNKRDSNGNLLPDSERLIRYGKFLRATSLDELPELINILKGDMSIVGPRPQLIKDLAFFDEMQIKRQSVRPGLTGLAQINGRNNISWEEKLQYDLEYIEKISLWIDIKIIFKTIIKVLACKDISSPGMDTSEDLGDYLLRIGKISHEEYINKLRSLQQH